MESKILAMRAFFTKDYSYKYNTWVVMTHPEITHRLVVRTAIFDVLYGKEFPESAIGTHELLIGYKACVDQMNDAVQGTAKSNEDVREQLKFLWDSSGNFDAKSLHYETDVIKILNAYEKRVCEAIVAYETVTATGDLRRTDRDPILKFRDRVNRVYDQSKTINLIDWTRERCKKDRFDRRLSNVRRINDFCYEFKEKTRELKENMSKEENKPTEDKKKE